VQKPSRPREDGSDRICGSLLPELVLSIMSGDCSVSCLSFHDIIRRHQNAGHETQTSVSLSDCVRLNISVIVLAGPDVASFALDHLSNHIVYQSMLIPKFLALEVGSIGFLVNFFEDILETAVVLLQDSVLGC
jgi:hypothetical protein